MLVGYAVCTYSSLILCEAPALSYSFPEQAPPLFLPYSLLLFKPKGNCNPPSLSGYFHNYHHPPLGIWLTLDGRRSLPPSDATPSTTSTVRPSSNFSASFLNFGQIRLPSTIVWSGLVYPARWIVRLNHTHLSQAYFPETHTCLDGRPGNNTLLISRRAGHNPSENLPSRTPLGFGNLTRHYTVGEPGHVAPALHRLPTRLKSVSQHTCITNHKTGHHAQKSKLGSP